MIVVQINEMSDSPVFLFTSPYIAFEVPLSAGLRWERILFQALFGTVSWRYSPDLDYST
jgi:hypothetical protein